MAKEIYKDIKGYEGEYKVSNCGNVYSCKRNIILKPSTTKNGYLRVSLCQNGIKKYFSIHRLVAEAFIPNPNNLPQVNHIDENKKNNNASNLE